jgi:hypothetical protein
MEQLQSGSKAEAGSFRCLACGFGVSLRREDRLPECPGCGGERFERAPLFAETAKVEVPLRTEPPSWLARARDNAGAGWFLAFDDGYRVRTVALDEGWTRIGRSLSAEVRLDDPTVSRRHALVHRERETVRVLDDRSLNGVFHNGRRVELDELADGDTIAIGRFELHFLHHSPDRHPSLTGA